MVNTCRIIVVVQAGTSFISIVINANFVSPFFKPKSVIFVLLGGMVDHLLENSSKIE